MTESTKRTYGVCSPVPLTLPDGLGIPGEHVELTEDEAAPFVADGQLVAIDAAAGDEPTEQPPPEPTEHTTSRRGRAGRHTADHTEQT